MSCKDYSNKLGQVLKVCKVQNINANINKLQNDIIGGVSITNIIENLYSYV